MSKNEILEELSKLSPEDLREIRDRIDELENFEDQEWEDLSEAEKSLIEQRIAEHDKNPGSAIPWDEVRARLRAKYRK